MEEFKDQLPADEVNNCVQVVLFLDAAGQDESSHAV
jgi:hypothetical protein